MSSEQLVSGIVSASALNATDCAVVVSRTNTLLRQMHNKIPIKVLGKAESCRHLVAIELAFRVENRPFNKPHFSQLLGSVSPKDFQHAVNLSCTFLQITLAKVSALDVLSVQIDASLRPAAVALLEDYNRRYVSQLDAARSASIDLNSPVYQAAAFYVAAVLQKRKPPLDRKRIIEATEVESSAFRTVEKSMLEKLGGDGAKNAHQPKIASKRPLPSAPTSDSSHSRLAVRPAARALDGGGANSSTATSNSLLLKAPASVSIVGGSTINSEINSDSTDKLPMPPPTRSIGAIPRQDQEKRRASLGLVADPAAQRLEERAAAEIEAQRKKDDERAKYEKDRLKILSRKRPAEGDP